MLSLIRATVALCNEYVRLADEESASKLEREVFELLDERLDCFGPSEFRGLFELWVFRNPKTSLSRLKDLLLILVAQDEENWVHEYARLVRELKSKQAQVELYEFWFQLIGPLEFGISRLKREVCRRLIDALTDIGDSSRASLLYKELISATPARTTELWNLRLSYAMHAAKFESADASENIWRETCSLFDWYFPDVVGLFDLLNCYERLNMTLHRYRLMETLLAHPSFPILQMLNSAIKFRVDDLIRSAQLSEAERLLRLRVSAGAIVDNYDPGGYWQLRLSEHLLLAGAVDESANLYHAVVDALTLAGDDVSAIVNARESLLKRVADHAEEERIANAIRSQANDAANAEFEQKVKERLSESKARMAKLNEMQLSVEQAVVEATMKHENAKSELLELESRNQSELSAMRKQIEKLESEKKLLSFRFEENLEALRLSARRTPERAQWRGSRAESDRLTRASSHPDHIVFNGAVERAILDFALFAHTRIELSGDVSVASITFPESTLPTVARGQFGNIYCPGHIRLEGMISVTGTIYGALLGRLPPSDRTRLLPISRPISMPDVNVLPVFSQLPKPIRGDLDGEYQTSHLELSDLGLTFRENSTIRILIHDEVDSVSNSATLVYANHGGNPLNLQIFYNGTRKIVMPHNSKVSAVIYAPNAEVVMPKGNHVFTGAIVANSIVGAGVMSIAYHEQLRAVEFAWI